MTYLEPLFPLFKSFQIMTKIRLDLRVFPKVKPNSVNIRKLHAAMTPIIGHTMRIDDPLLSRNVTLSWPRNFGNMPSLPREANLDLRFLRMRLSINRSLKRCFALKPRSSIAASTLWNQPIFNHQIATSDVITMEKKVYAQLTASKRKVN